MSITSDADCIGGSGDGPCYVGVVRVVRATDFTAPAWALYRTSLLYLALLFGAVLADGLVPQGPALDAEDTPLILENPDLAAERALPSAGR